MVCWLESPFLIRDSLIHAHCKIAEFLRKYYDKHSVLSPFSDYDVCLCIFMSIGSSRKEMTTRCGTDGFSKLRTNGENYMFLEFQTDGSYAYTGFYIGASSSGKIQQPTSRNYVA